MDLKPGDLVKLSAAWDAVAASLANKDRYKNSLFEVLYTRIYSLYTHVNVSVVVSAVWAPGSELTFDASSLERV